MSLTPDCRVIAIVGGGFTGAAVSIHLARKYAAGGNVRIVVFEPRGKLGTGLAYSTLEKAHRINVPAGKMTLYPDDPESFLRFAVDKGVLLGDPEALATDGLPYLRRSDFGAYVTAEIEPYIRSGVIEHVGSNVTAIEKSGHEWRLHTGRGNILSADVVAIAVSHPEPALPSALANVKDHPKLIGDVTRDYALQPVEADDRVLIVGNGLTSADVVATLKAQGHRGTIVSISRRGLRSRGHGPANQEPLGDFISAPSIRASDLLHRIRKTLRQAHDDGLTWHAVLDALRAQGHDIWRALPVQERRRIARLARPYWDAHRFRVAPQVEKIIDDAIASGCLSVQAASVRKVTRHGAGFDVILTEKGRDEPVEAYFDAIAVTTGPAHGGILDSQPFLSALQEAGTLISCETGLGIACNENSVAIDRHGSGVAGLYIAGPLARGTFGELMGLPQVTEHAVFIANQVSAFLDLEPSSRSKAG